MENSKNIINDSPHNWVNNNRTRLLYYKNQYISFTDQDGIIAYDVSLDKLIEKTNKTHEKYSTYFVNPHHLSNKKRILPIFFKTVRTTDWIPLYSITLEYKNIAKTLPMLIDSGADCSLISWQTGTQLGLTKLDTDVVQYAYGIGEGRISYITKQINIIIAEYTIKTPVAWVQSPDYQDEIIGREVVFDAFDIEFKQAEEMIIFKKRPSNDVQ